MTNKLTDKQKEMLQVYKNDGIKIGLDTSPIDPIRLEQAVNLLYKCGGLVPPKTIEVVKGPKELLSRGKEVYGDGFDFFSMVGYGQHDISWVMFYKFFAKECGDSIERAKEYVEKLAGLEAISRECGWYLAFDEAFIACEKPTEIHLNSEGMLHNPKGPAVVFNDGFTVYSLNGIRIPDKYFQNTLTARVIMGEPNVDIRRELLRLVGLESFIKELGGTVIDSLTVDSVVTNLGDKTRPVTYELLQLDLGDGIMGKALKMDNPSIDAMHVEGVPDECMSVKDALAWRNGFDTYVPGLVVT